MVNPKSSSEVRKIKFFVTGSILTSFGVLLITTGGSWDITNHLLNKPETFFSPPHSVLYLGVAVALAGTIISFFSWKKLIDFRDYFALAIKLNLIGIFFLVGAGPIDFLWHSNFGLDGLLSPPHLSLICGMLLTGIAAMINLARFVNFISERPKFDWLIVLSVLPVLLAASGLFYSFSLPFSNTQFFEFNPEPTFAAIFASFAFPFLLSFSLLSVTRLVKYKFGILSLTGILFLIINWSTTIMPNPSLHDTTLFYFLNIVPLVAIDVLIFQFQESKLCFYVIGGILGSVYYFIYYPLITHVFNEIISQQLVWPSITSSVYFTILPDVLLLTTIQAVLLGMTASYFSKKITQKITTK